MKKNHWRACLAIFRIQLAQGLQYRMAALSAASISIFWALIEITVFTVFYTYAKGGVTSMNGLTLSQAVSYVWIAQAMVPLQPMSVDGEILSQITSGNVGIALCRPLGLYEQWFAHTAAGRLSACWLRAGLTVLAGIVLPGSLRMLPPASLLGLLLFFISAASALLLCTAYGMLITAVRLNITWGEGPTYMLLLLSGVLSGGYLPLQLWPDILQKVLLYQPFAGYLDIPARLYVGTLAPQAGLMAIGTQLLWIAAFIAAGRALMRRKLNTLIVQGG